MLPEFGTVQKLVRGGGNNLSAFFAGLRDGYFLGRRRGALCVRPPCLRRCASTDAEATDARSGRLKKVLLASSQN